MTEHDREVLQYLRSQPRIAWLEAHLRATMQNEEHPTARIETPTADVIVLAWNAFLPNKILILGDKPQESREHVLFDHHPFQ